MNETKNDANFSEVGNWLNAETLSERLRALRQNPQALQFFDRAKAEERLAAWKEIPAFASDEECFLRRLQMHGCSPEEFLHILGTPPDKIFKAGHVPHWLSEFIASEQEPECQIKSEALDDARAKGLLSPFLGLICFYARRLLKLILMQEDLLSSTRLPAENMLDLFLSPFLPLLEQLCQRSVALEINAMRLLGQLEGDTPEARFKSFSKKMTDVSQRREFLNMYPVLLRSLQRKLELWVEASAEFLERLARDSEEIRSVFGIDASDSLLEFNPSGDTHCHGRAVVIVSFLSGKKILYKPHSLSIDRNFQELLNWCNHNGFNPPLKTIAVLPKGRYGWVEFVVNRHCQNDAEIGAFYTRLGLVLSLFYAMGTVDVHFENLVAAGPDPVVIDLETLFHSEPEAELRTASDAVLQKIRDSVIRTGLLPVPQASEGNSPFDISGIGANVGQVAPYKVPWLLNVGKDDMHIENVSLWIPSVHNRPSDDVTKEIPAQKLLDGFKCGLQVLTDNRELLLAPEGPLSRFCEDAGRVVLRPSVIYGRLAMDATHPDLLHDELDRAMHWDILWTGISHQPFLEKCILSEMRQIAEGDIPFFAAEVNSTTLVGGDGTRIESLLRESGLANARKRIEKLSEDVLEEQCWFIRASLGFLDGYVKKPLQKINQTGEIDDPGDAWHRPYRQDGAQVAHRQSGAQDAPVHPYLKAACDAGSEVVSQLTFFKGMASCLSVNCIGSEDDGGKLAFSILPAGQDLYDGLPGIALFLAYLGRESDEQAYTKAAEALLANLQEMKPELKQVGLFTGLGSLVYLYLHLARLWNRPELLVSAEELLPDISLLIEKDRVLDVIAGSAGCLLGLLQLARLRPEGNALRIALRCGDRLIGGVKGSEQHSGPNSGPNSEPDSDPNSKPNVTPLPIKRGFSHGISGIAFALFELSRVSGEEKYKRIALEAIEQERKLLSGGQWIDHHLRQDGSTQTSWCHGATGIALSRLGIYRSFADPSIRQDIELALSECNRHYWMPSHCLCHGTMGNLEPFLIASYDFPEFGDWSSLIDQVVQRLLSDIRDKGWRTEQDPNQLLNLSLMTGISGMGFAFLRLHNPCGVPSILSMDGPVLARNR